MIAKDPSATYRPGARSPKWVKFKNLHRISCVVAGYTAGTGSREHMGALLVALVDLTPGSTDGVVLVGRVGSGFTEADTWELKERVDRKELVVIEVECLNRSKDNQLRFPVFKGIRSDLEPRDCSVSQLDALPLC